MTSAELRETLQLQLTETDLLQCMFPGEGEFCLDDESTGSFSIVRSFLERDDAVKAQKAGRVSNAEPEEANFIPPPRLSFSIKLMVGDVESTSRANFQLLCCLPHEYPKCLPELNVHSDSLSRQGYRQLNDDLHEHLKELGQGELCITEAIQWLQSNALAYITSDKAGMEKESIPGGVDCPKSFTRLWIHSHHIYSRSKRENIFTWAKETGLTGFSLPGKPGIICVEGPREDVDCFWHKIRRLNWKKLTSKHREDFTLGASKNEAGLHSTCAGQRRFADFQEINFDVRGSRDYHMDLGQFFQYLERHNCADIFKILLGVDGRVSQKDS